MLRFHFLSLPSPKVLRSLNLSKWLLWAKLPNNFYGRKLLLMGTVNKNGVILRMMDCFLRSCERLQISFLLFEKIWVHLLRLVLFNFKLIFVLNPRAEFVVFWTWKIVIFYLGAQVFLFPLNPKTLLLEKL